VRLALKPREFEAALSAPAPARRELKLAEPRDDA